MSGVFSAPNSMIPSFYNESVIRTCTGRTEIVQGKVQKGQVLPEPPGINRTVRELGCSSECVWKVSSCKRPELGVDKLRDSMRDTFWQSDGDLPQIVTMTFHKRVEVSSMYLCISLKEDSSYCPKVVEINAGNVLEGLSHVTDQVFEDPDGWVRIPIEVDGKPVKCKILQLFIKENHESGKDSHVRQVNIYGPRPNMFTLGNGVYCESLEFQRWLFPR